MALTDKQIYDLNNSMVAAQNVSLGNIISGITSTLPTSGSILAIFGDAQNNTSFEADGTMIFSGSATVWDDIFFPLVTAKQGQTDKPAFSVAEVAYLFPQADTSASMLMVAQFPHSYKIGSSIDPHVHWKQTQSGSVVYKMAYKWFPIGGNVPATWEIHAMNNSVVTYTSGSIHQLNYGSMISGSMLASGVGVSSIMLIKLYREDNTYAGDAVTYQFDIHFEKDTLGSRTEYSK